MSSSLEKLKKELETAQRALSECEDRSLRQKIENTEVMGKQIEQAYHEWISALDVVEDPIFIHDKELCILRCNRAYQQLSGLPFKQIIGRPYYDIFPKNHLLMHQCQQLLKQSITEKIKEEEEVEVQVGDILFRSRAYITKDEQGGYLYSTHILEDITERKAAVEALRASEEKFHSITASAQDAIIMMDDEGKVSYWNEAAENMFGFPSQEVIGESLHTLIAPERFLAAHNIGFSHFRKTGEGPAVGKTLELAALKKNGTEFPIEMSLSSIMSNGHWNAIGIIRDITERKESEETLRRANRALRTLSAGNLALVRATSEDMLLQSVTNVIAEKGNYSLAMVCYTENNPEKSITPVVWSGIEDGNFAEGCRSVTSTGMEQLPVARAIRNKTTQILRDITSEAEFKPWRDAALAHGYVSNITIPLSDGSIAFGALSIYSSETNAFDEEEVRLLEELASDLAYGIITLRTRVEHEQHATILRESLEQSIQTIVSTVEIRDPYTAGHQRRVGELATAIAQEMGLSEEEIQGIHFASIIHDLGKIHVPAEILSKPGKLSKIEFMLIQTHPQAGYDILKDVKFPWPIADIILQHHEKLDGSGYPQGLKGDQIRLEAKIITVADVVEAMSSHRPYRSALGIEIALDEIRRGRGGEYDPAVVDACLKIFSEKGFAFSNESL